MTLYPIGIQNFASLRKDGYAYVDKTMYIHRLAHTGRYYFLSRPRRFGKSLLLSAMKSYFLGEKELFKGLALERLETEWTKYPVLYLDINSGKYTDEGSLVAVLDQHLRLWEAEYGCQDPNTTLAYRFIHVIRRAVEQTGQRVVILVDEYDKPMLQTISDEQRQKEHRSELKAFYSVLKTMDGYIKFAFLTGVTKFGKVSVFSDLNNLEDISMLARYVGICGLTETEIHDYFEEGLKELAEANRMSYEETLATLRRRYDGYHFEAGSEGIYNPFSVINTLKNKDFKDYWFETGTPTFLVEVMQRLDFVLPRLDAEPVDADTLNCVDPLSQSPVPVIYQAGYLTIHSYDPIMRLYTLDFPNEEVREGFLRFLLPSYTPQSKGKGAFFVGLMRKAVLEGRTEDFMELLRDFFDEGDYRVAGRAELYYQNALYIVFRLLGLYAQVEVATARGRIDLSVETPHYIYIIEVKLDGTPEAALEQIARKGYARKYATDTRRVERIGVNFSSEARSIVDWKIEAGD